MPTFQLDECIDNKRIRHACAAANRAELRRFPPDLKTERIRKLGLNKDWHVLPRLLEHDLPILTHDRMIIEENPSCIPESNPGLITVYDRGSTTDNPQRLLTLIGKLKACLPSWDELSIRNSIIKLEGNRTGGDRVRIGHIKDGLFVLDVEFVFGRDNDVERILNALDANAAQGQLTALRAKDQTGAPGTAAPMWPSQS